MKKKLLIIIPIVVVLLAIIGLSAYLLFSGNEFERGRVVVCYNGITVFVGEDGQFWQMNPSGIAKGQVSALKTGDRVTVFRSTAMAMSYPGQCRVTLCFKSLSDDDGAVSQSVLDELEYIGWIKEPNIGGADTLPESDSDREE